MLRYLVVLVLPLSLGGCPSLMNSGYTEVTYAGPLCNASSVNITVKTGKEYGSIEGGCQVDPTTKQESASFRVVDVKAFEGQQIAAGVSAGILSAFANLASTGASVATGIPLPKIKPVVPVTPQSSTAPTS